MFGFLPQQSWCLWLGQQLVGFHKRHSKAKQIEANQILYMRIGVVSSADEPRCNGAVDRGRRALRNVFRDQCIQRGLKRAIDPRQKPNRSRSGTLVLGNHLRAHMTRMHRHAPHTAVAVASIALHRHQYQIQFGFAVCSNRIIRFFIKPVR
jgi:hypothetical protein